MGFWETFFFWFFALGALGTSCTVILVRNPLYCALALIADFFCFAGLYVLLSAHFLAVVQILVYGGAIMVLFLFIIMLLNLHDQNLAPNRFQLHYVVAVVAGVVMVLFSAGVILSAVNLGEVDEIRECMAVVEQVDDEETTADDLDEQQREDYDECLALFEELEEQGRQVSDDPRAIETAIPGLYADASEEAVEQAYRQKLREWKQQQARPSDGKWPEFDPERTYELPPSLDPDPDERLVTPGKEGAFGTFKPVSIKLVNRFVIPFELTAILLLAAIVGAVILAKRRVA